MNKSHLLIDESPLQVLPSLAVAIGLEEAIILQQLHYWLSNPKNLGRVDEDGNKWVFNTYEEWHEDNFPFWNPTKIQRLFLSLEKSGVVISAQFDAKKHDMKKFYRIDYGKLCTMDDSFLPLSNNAKVNDVKRNTETTSETTQRDSPDGAQPPEKSLLTIDLEKLESVFSLARKVPLPDWNNDPKGSQKTWRTPLKEIYKQCKNDVDKTEIIVCEAVENMRRDGLTFTKPIQILEVAISLIADRGMTSKGNGHTPNPTRRIILPDGQIVDA